LAHHGVLGITDVGLDFEILLAPTGEDRDLPPLLLDVVDGRGHQPEVGVEERVDFSWFGVPVNDAAQGFGGTLRLWRSVGD
jgi:hypothetical protein